MPRPRARRAAPRGAQIGVGEERLQQRREARIAHLAGQVFEEAVELVEVAVGDRQEGRRVGLRGGRFRDRPYLELELVAEALDAPGDTHEVTALEPAREHVGVAEGTGLD